MGTYLERDDIFTVEDRIQDGFAEGAKVDEVGVAGRLYGRETLGPTSAFIPCEGVETDFMDETDGVDGWTCKHERHCQLVEKGTGGLEVPHS